MKSCCLEQDHKIGFHCYTSFVQCSNEVSVEQIWLCVIVDSMIKYLQFILNFSIESSKYFMLALVFNCSFNFNINDNIGSANIDKQEHGKWHDEERVQILVKIVSTMYS